jgi:hypothetical protein
VVAFEAGDVFKEDEGAATFAMENLHRSIIMRQ